MEGNFLFQRLKQGLTKTRHGWLQRLEGIFQIPRQEDALDAMEELLLSADVGVKATDKLISAIRERLTAEHAKDLAFFLQQEIRSLLMEGDQKRAAANFLEPPYVILFLGVNGVGKTTTIGKLAAKYRQGGRKVLLVAADTFRAAAIEQLEIWARSVDSDVVKHKPGADPSAVVFDGIRAAKRRGTDVILIDTAGRLHTKVHLVEELKKIRRVISREHPGAPHETLLVLDATTGQNAFLQARIFKESLDITGIVLTKLDGTAKGGVILGIQEELGIPVQYIGVGEELEDLQPFDASLFVKSLFEKGEAA